MNLFVNDIPIRLLRPGKSPSEDQFSKALDTKDGPVTRAGLLGHLWIKNASTHDLDDILNLINSNVPIDLRSLSISISDYARLKSYLKRKFKVIKAAGGLIRKKERFLMIFRQKKWDLPKGKKEKGERYRQTAVREVEEECNVSVRLGKKICTTWHTYTMNKKSMLKKTRWYVMDVVNDARMKPSVEEDIEDVRWMTRKEVYHGLENSYNSIRFVFEAYYEKVEKLK